MYSKLVRKNGKDMTINLIVRSITKTQYFPRPYETFGGDINVKVDLFNYATKARLKDATRIDTSNFTLRSKLASLKTEVDKLDIDKLVPVPVDFSKLRDVVKDGCC